MARKSGGSGKSGKGGFGNNKRSASTGRYVTKATVDLTRQHPKGRRRWK